SIFNGTTINKKMRLDHESLSHPETRILKYHGYSHDDFFKPHSDGAWPGSRIIDNELIANAFPDRYSQMTFLIYLNDEFEGGATRFLVNANDTTKPAKTGDAVVNIDVRTPAGSILCFPHGMHPLHCIHSSVAITKGVKYIIRSDVLFVCPTKLANPST
ncbi:MAG: 2OG-Fe(II) oxygenase, partial [Colwellia sp.]|nr:2OG-Fe(II) oxygenase [Colwellia sp.]